MPVWGAENFGGCHAAPGAKVQGMEDHRCGSPAYVPKLKVPSKSMLLAARSALGVFAAAHPIRAVGRWVAERTIAMVARTPR